MLFFFNNRIKGKKPSVLPERFWILVFDFEFQNVNFRSQTWITYKK